MSVDTSAMELCDAHSRPRALCGECLDADVSLPAQTKPPQLIVGVKGWAGAGKDEVGKVLVESGFTRVSLGTPVYDLALEVNPLIPTPNMYTHTHRRLKDLVDELGWDRVKRMEEVRRVLQGVGDGARRVIGTYVWVHVAAEKIRNVEGDVVITDVRQANEIDWIRSQGGMVGLVTRPGVGPANAYEEQHHGFEGFEPDFTINNDADLKALKEETLKILLLKPGP